MRLITSLRNLRGKVVLLRSDLNVESVKERFKLEKALATILFLKRKGAITIVMSHRGRPTGVDSTQSLRLLLPFLRKHLHAPITFIPVLSAKAITEAVGGAKAGSLFLLENVRFHSGEDTLDQQWAQELAATGDIYVNDAFASHHPGVTVTELPKLLPHYAGLQMMEEVTQLNRIMKNPKKPLVVILAGGKAADKFAVIKHLHPNVAHFIIGGVLANTFFRARGTPIGSSVVDESILPEVGQMLKDKKIVLPMDWVADSKGKILDLGLLSAEHFANIIKTAGTIIWNGPMGYFEDPKFRAGSVAIAKAVATSSAFSVVGGGETTSLIINSKLEKKIGFLSTGGGAMLGYLAGRRMPGIEALK